MAIDIGVLIVGTETPSGNINSDADKDDWVWLNYITGEMHKFNPNTGQYDITIPVPSHLHETLGDINFTGNISVGGESGITGSRLIPNVGTLTFKKGILTGFVPV